MTTAEQIESVAANLGLSMSAEFVPFSKSRNAKEKMPSLNWKVTIHKTEWLLDKSKGKKYDILTTDYSAGCAHCPGYGSRDKYSESKIVPMECETGKVCHYGASADRAHSTVTPILPKFADVLYSLVLDASVINSGGFEDWAKELGYDADSRKAEATYRSCLEIALKFRNAIGEAGLKELQDACQDY